MQDVNAYNDSEDDFFDCSDTPKKSAQSESSAMEDGVSKINLNDVETCTSLSQQKTDRTLFSDNDAMSNDEQNHNKGDCKSEDEINHPTAEDLEELQKKITEMKEVGNAEFKLKNYERAQELYTEALEICSASLSHDRSILYSNRSASLMHQDKKEEAVADCTEAIALNPTYTKAILRRAELQESLDKLDNALEDFKRVLELEPDNHKAMAACVRLPPVIEARNEKMKAEMLGTLKDLGNKVLGKFGLSTDNFHFEQNPETGGYNIQFNQNPSS